MDHDLTAVTEAHEPPVSHTTLWQRLVHAGPIAFDGDGFAIDRALEELQQVADVTEAVRALDALRSIGAPAQDPWIDCTARIARLPGAAMGRRSGASGPPTDASAQLACAQLAWFAAVAGSCAQRGAVLEVLTISLGLRDIVSMMPMSLASAQQLFETGIPIATPASPVWPADPLARIETSELPEVYLLGTARRFGVPVRALKWISPLGALMVSGQSGLVPVRAEYSRWRDALADPLTALVGFESGASVEDSVCQALAGTGELCALDLVRCTSSHPWIVPALLERVDLESPQQRAALDAMVRTRASRALARSMRHHRDAGVLDEAMLLAWVHAVFGSALAVFGADRATIAWPLPHTVRRQQADPSRSLACSGPLKAALLVWLSDPGLGRAPLGPMLEESVRRGFERGRLDARARVAMPGYQAPYPLVWFACQLGDAGAVSLALAGGADAAESIAGESLAQFLNRHAAAFRDGTQVAELVALISRRALRDAVSHKSRGNAEEAG